MLIFANYKPVLVYKPKQHAKPYTGLIYAIDI